MRLHVDLEPVTCFAALGESWRALERGAGEDGLSFFRSWTWMGCLAEERFPEPVLLRARAGDGRTLGLALFNHHRGRLCLGESGDAALDAPFIEHNGPLLANEAGPAVARALLHAAWRRGGARRLVLGGVPPALLAAMPGTALRLQRRLAPRVRLDEVRAAGGDYLATLSANTRYQLRRSARIYAARGALALRPAQEEGEALAWLEALAELHGQSWRRRGRPGAFADPFMRRFHRTLVARALGQGELELLRLTAGAEVVGYLYNFRLNGQVLAYQSGFSHEGADPHAKPGLTCHHLAVERALAAGDAVYDFLAGADRYKLSLANAALPLVWAEAVPAWSPLGLAARARRALHRLRRPAAPAAAAPG